MISANEHRASQNPEGRFAFTFAVVAVAVAVAVRWLLDPVLGDSVPYITLFLAVICAAWYGGTQPALLAAILGALVAQIFFIPPRFSLAIENGADLVGLAVFLANCVAIAYLGGRMRLAEQRSRQRETLLRVTLTSIGDAVVTTDVHGMVTAINAVASQLTGWPAAEALGRPFQEILRLVNEATRETAENPVSHVLAKGHIVGLANHTVLISRDGTERPIDDSAAPIRDAQRGHDRRRLGISRYYRAQAGGSRATSQ